MSRMKKPKSSKPVRRQTFEAAMEYILLPDAEELTETLIQELIGRGYTENQLRELQKNGFKYSRSRDSFWGD